MQDLESRIVTCMETLQGFNAADIAKTPFGSGEMANVTALATWIAAESKGMRFDLPQAHAEERSSTNWANARFSSALAHTIFRAPPAMATTTSASACKTCPT